MAAQAALPQRSSSAAMAAELRADQVTALRQRNNISVGNIPMQPASDSAAQDQADEFQRSRNADRYANSIGSPMASLYASLGEQPNQAQEAANTNFEETQPQDTAMDQEAMQNYIAMQSQIEDSEQARMRFQSLSRTLKEKENTEEFQKVLDEVKKFVQKRQTDLAAKGASFVDEGELLEILDTVGVAISTYQAVVSIFQGSIPEEVKKNMTIPPLDFSKSTADVASAAGSIMQFMKYFLMVFVLIPFVIAFQVTAFVAFCDWFTPCSLLWGGVFDAVGM
ncbi:MAG: hypothetical protein UY72_C0008G0009 [Candidatus Uhrbacteria bacterium GW2011_GWD2_52_7]|uniref:Uncharacterized protein n=1 Tax=Candidatus Uhrbacteria bacterium GW2011_GWD2_52_7 TaxID=1618989 RepID=A0A0G1XHY9_9BACT|nr:MAG: hypothetical protein UY72_C0008G0009 [Candidatus Uhrbacteria bacterium GW2011_GWD2_52_7]